MSKELSELYMVVLLNEYHAYPLGRDTIMRVYMVDKNGRGYCTKGSRCISTDYAISFFVRLTYCSASMSTTLIHIDDELIPVYENWCRERWRVESWNSI